MYTLLKYISILFSILTCCMIYYAIWFGTEEHLVKWIMTIAMTFIIALGTLAIYSTLSQEV